MNITVRAYSPLMRLVPQHWGAIAFGHTIHLRADSAPLPLLAHEATHCIQFAEAGGMLRGLIRWLTLLTLYGYEQHPWEREARAVEQRALRDPTWGRRFLGQIGKAAPL